MVERSLRRWQIAVGWVAAALVALALWLSFSAPRLTYSSDPPDTRDDIVIRCDLSGFDDPYLATQTGITLNYSVIRGDSALSRAKDEASTREGGDLWFQEHSIERDCIAAEIGRQRWTIWTLAGVGALGLIFTALGLLRVIRTSHDLLGSQRVAK